jgi:hypothetical protein
MENKISSIPTPPIININMQSNTEKNGNQIYYTDFKEEIKEAAVKINKGKKNQVFKAKNIPQAKQNQNSQPIICSYCNKEIETSIFKYHMESHPSKILDWLYLGSYNNATNKKELEYAGVKYIVNCAQECKNLFEKDFNYKHFKLSVRKN